MKHDFDQRTANKEKVVTVTVFIFGIHNFLMHLIFL